MDAIDQVGRRERLRTAMKTSAAALRDHSPSFALAGSYALWVYGAPEPDHDVDFVVAEADAQSAALTLAAAGFIIEQPPEDWLFKARTGDVVVDVLHHVNGAAVDSAMLQAAEYRDVLAVRMPVLPPSTVMIQKLRALEEHYCDFTSLLPAVRATREVLDWDRIRKETADNDYAVAFLVLTERLGLTVRAAVTASAAAFRPSS
ncbi:hypothetical protein A5784_36550 [Mycobacterium sp. 852013-50091_SCH5140682]|uniref:hypothetical protein n=1 Tax=Mycobacterium sp. 852013-50091_SCH5140682 TaxID=1834109 RepID=UPI0007EB3E8B|nr:hypothetical protein [Mycobacterium sp. 852013-50091_SCH5140682]OBC10533.1 hypothetical protein A5784_36550 [Mycobacterium sp. 852013-50091_SCH5140682]